MTRPRPGPDPAPRCLPDDQAPGPLLYEGPGRSHPAPDPALDLENHRADPDHARTMRDAAKAAAAAAPRPAAKETM